MRRAEKIHGEEFLKTFCKFPADLGLTSPSTVILEGVRGSGKSTALRAIGELPRHGQENLATDGRLVVGTYMSFGPTWFAAFEQTKSLGCEQRYALFSASLNLGAIRHFTQSLERYMGFCGLSGRGLAERGAEYASLLSSPILTAPPDALSLKELRCILDRCWVELRDSLYRFSLTGNLALPESFLFLDPLDPLQKAVQLIAERDDTESKVLWILLLDEVDLLDEDSQKCINGAIRDVRQPLAIKLACLPHGHRTGQTQAGGVSVSCPHDFEYRPIPTDPKDADVRQFCEDVYKARVRLFDSGLPEDPVAWLGAGGLRLRLQPFLEESETAESRVAQELEAGRSLFRESSRSPASLRQHVPPLAVRTLRKKTVGNARPAVYCGWRDLVSLSDANPRRLLRLLDQFFRAASDEGKLSDEEQSSLLKGASEGVFQRLRSLPAFGRNVQTLVERVGERLQRELHEGPLRSDSMSLELDLSRFSGEEESLLKICISYGVLNPWTFPGTEGFPSARARYSLSFGLAPRYWLVPRRGRCAFVLRELAVIDRDTAQLQLELDFSQESEKKELT